MSFILTATGQRFDYTDPEGHVYSIQDIAHALSHQCRFLGHTSRFYSVSEHSRLVSALCQRAGHGVQSELVALLHDVAEAYIGDVPTPLKQMFPLYKNIEDKVLATALPQLIPSYTHVAGVEANKIFDMLALTIEVEYLMPDQGRGVKWIGALNGPGTESHVEKARYEWVTLERCAVEDEAELFLKRYYELVGSIKGA